MNRRQLIARALALGVQAWPASQVLAQARSRRKPLTVPRVNGAINVHPVRRFDQVSDFTPPVIVPELVDRQMRQVYELGFERTRTTISFSDFGPDFLAAIPYVRGARALGVDVLGILGQFGFGFDLTRALSDPWKRAVVLDTVLEIFAGEVSPASHQVARAGDFALQILNEPSHFLGLDPGDYVRHFLGPVYRDLKERRSDLVVVSAATVGSRDGVPRLRRMIEAGMERSCDVVAIHVYDLRTLTRLAGLFSKPVWVTESGSFGTGTHLDWFRNTFARIRLEIPEVVHIFYFDLFDNEPGGFRLIDIRQDPAAGAVLEVESGDLYDFLVSRARTALGKRPAVDYAELVPDITRYFPTDHDLALIDAARAVL